jgi:hypothetical protein
MPQIPIYNRSAKLTTQAPSVQRDESFASTQGQAIQGLGQALGQVAQRWQQTVDTAQLNSYKARKEVSLADLQARANADQNPNNADTYIKELKKVKEKSLEGLNPRVKRVAEAELQKDLALAEIKIRNNFRKKTVQSGDIDLKLTTNKLVEDIINADTEKVRQDKIKEMKNTLDLNVGTIISRAERDKRLAEKEEEIREGIINKDLYSNPEMFLQNLKEYDFKNAKEKSDKEEEAKGLIKREKKESRDLEKEAVIQTRFEVISKIATGNLKEKDYPKVIKQVSSTDAKLAEAMQKNIQNGGFANDKIDVDALDSKANKDFIQLAGNVIKAKDAENASNFIVGALTDNNRISRDRLTGLVWAARMRSKEIENKGKEGFLKRFFNDYFLPGVFPPYAAVKIIERLGKENATPEEAKEIIDEEVDYYLGYSRESLEATADKYGLEIYEVIDNLRARGR